MAEKPKSGFRFTDSKGCIVRVKIGAYFSSKTRSSDNHSRNFYKFSNLVLLYRFHFGFICLKTCGFKKMMIRFLFDAVWFFNDSVQAELFFLANRLI